MGAAWAIKRKSAEAFKEFMQANPPRMPKEFTNAEYKRVMRYAFIAFRIGYRTGVNDTMRGEL